VRAHVPLPERRGCPAMSMRVQTSLAWLFTFGLCVVMLSAAMNVGWLISPLATR
jgi:hypothetical protein